MSGFPFSQPMALVFHGTLGAILVLYALYWLRLVRLLTLHTMIKLGLLLSLCGALHNCSHLFAPPLASAEHFRRAHVPDAAAGPADLLRTRDAADAGEEQGQGHQEQLGFLQFTLGTRLSLISTVRGAAWRCSYMRSLLAVLHMLWIGFGFYFLKFGPSLLEYIQSPDREAATLRA